MPISPRMKAPEWGMLVFLSFLWGGSFFLASVALKEIQPFTLVFCRMTLGAAALGAVMVAQGVRFPADARTWRGLAFLGVFANALPFGLMYWGQTHVSSGLAAILTAAAPLFTAVIAHFVTSDEKLRGFRLLGILIGMAGVAVVIGPSALAESAHHIGAQVAILGAALCFGVGGIYAKRFCKLPPAVPACGQLIFAALAILPVMAAFEQPLSHPLPGAASVASVLALALLCEALAFLIYFRLLARVGATNSALISLLVPATAIFLGAAVLGEALLPRHFIGLAVIGCGLLVTDGGVIDYIRSRFRAKPSGPLAPHMLNDHHPPQP